jgi:hypothetical protein
MDEGVGLAAIEGRKEDEVKIMSVDTIDALEGDDEIVELGMLVIENGVVVGEASGVDVAVTV